MKLKHVLIAGAVSCSVGSVAFAQQAQEAQPSKEGGMRQHGQMMEQKRSEMGRTQASGGMKAQKQGAAGAQQQYPQETVRKVQQKLNEEGFSAGPVDGVWGPKTQSALRNYQEKKGIEATGQLDEKTLAELDVEAKPKTGAGGAAGDKEGAAKDGAGGAAKEDAAKEGASGAAGKEDAAKEGAAKEGGAKEDAAKEGAGGATGAQQPGQEGAQKPGEQGAQQPGQSQSR